MIKDYNILEYKNNFIWIGEIPNNYSHWVINWFVEPLESSLTKLYYESKLEILGGEYKKLIDKLKIIDSENDTIYLNGILYCKTEGKYLLIFGRNDSRNLFMPEDFLKNTKELIEEYQKNINIANAKDEQRITEVKKRFELEIDKIKSKSGDDKSIDQWKKLINATDYFHYREEKPKELMIENLNSVPKIEYEIISNNKKVQHVKKVIEKIDFQYHSRECNFNLMEFDSLDSNKILVAKYGEKRKFCPSHPEIRFFINHSLKKVVYKPKLQDTSKPTKKYGKKEITASDSESIYRGFERDELFKLSDLIPENDENTENIKVLISDEGLEALGWYQPFHYYTEETWGIYLDAERLMNLAFSFRDEGIRNMGDAVQLAVRLVYQHEYFHALVETVVSYNEMNSLKRHYLDYRKKVYDVSVNTEECLEEALANWYALDACKDFHDRNTVKVIKNLFELCPPGYNNWALGDQSNTWNKLLTQLQASRIDGKINRSIIPNGRIFFNQPFDMLPTDVPVYFYGKNILSNFYFSVPTVMEARKVLEYFKYNYVPKGGKGSHEKWCHENGDCFVLPKRDPLSRGVFNSMLQKLGIRKKEYVNEIRKII